MPWGQVHNLHTPLEVAHPVRLGGRVQTPHPLTAGAEYLFVFMVSIFQLQKIFSFQIVILKNGVQNFKTMMKREMTLSGLST